MSGTNTSSDHAKAVYCTSIDIDRTWSVVVGINANVKYVARVIAYKNMNGRDGFVEAHVSTPQNTPKAALENLLGLLRLST